MAVFTSFGCVVQKKGIDEAYIDLTAEVTNLLASYAIT
jgi:hypothetical protein